MGRTPTTSTADEPATPEIMTSAFLADILTMEMVGMIDEATKRHEAAHRGRERGPVLAALRGTVREIRKVHGLTAIDWRTHLPVTETASDNGAEPEAAEVTS